MIFLLRVRNIVLRVPASGGLASVPRLTIPKGPIALLGIVAIAAIGVRKICPVIRGRRCRTATALGSVSRRGQHGRHKNGGDKSGLNKLGHDHFLC